MDFLQGHRVLPSTGFPFSRISIVTPVSHKRVRQGRLIASILISLVAGVPHAWAQIQIETEIGFQQTVIIGHWMPLRVRLYNPGGSRDGEVFVRVVRGRAALPMEYRQPVEIAHQGRRTFDFVVPLLRTDHLIRVGMRDAEGRLIAEHTVDLQGTRTADALILALTRDFDLQFLPSLFARKTRVAYVRPGGLPVHWSGLDGVKSVIVHEVSLSELDRQRYQALKDWVVAGGTLIFAAGASYSTLQEPRARELLPVTVRGLRRVERLARLPNLDHVDFPAGEWLLLESELRIGQVSAAAGDLPLVAQRPLGLGRVVFLAVDYATPRLSNWPGNFALWELLLPRERQTAAVSAMAEELELNSQRHPLRGVLRQPLLNVPSHLTVAAALAAYLILLFLAMAWLSKRDGHRWIAWVGIAALVLGGAAAVQWGLRDPILAADGAIFRLQTHMLHGSGSRGRVIEHTAVFSARGGSLRLTIDDPNSVIRAVARVGGTQEPGTGAPLGAAQDGTMAIVRKGTGTLWKNLRLPRYAANLFTLESVADVPVSLSIDRLPTGTELTFRNRGDAPVEGIAVLHRGSYYRLGRLLPGEERTEEFFDIPLSADHATTPVADVLSTRLASDVRGVNAEIPAQMLRRHFRHRKIGKMENKVIWVGWSRDSGGGLQLEGGEAYGFSLSLYVAEVAL